MLTASSASAADADANAAPLLEGRQQLEMDAQMRVANAAFSRVGSSRSSPSSSLRRVVAVNVSELRSCGDEQSQQPNAAPPLCSLRATCSKLLAVTPQMRVANAVSTLEGLQQVDVDVQRREANAAPFLEGSQRSGLMWCGDVQPQQANAAPPLCSLQAPCSQFPAVTPQMLDANAAPILEDSQQLDVYVQRREPMQRPI